MNKTNLRLAVIVFGLFTAAVHLYLNIRPGYGFSYPFPGAFLLNGLGYLALLAALFMKIPALDGVRRYIPWALMLFAAATIGAFLKFGDMSDMLGWVTKADEVLLIGAVFLYQRA
jgi:hypothetical protein